MNSQVGSLKMSRKGFDLAILRGLLKTYCWKPLDAIHMSFRHRQWSLRVQQLPEKVSELLSLIAEYRAVVVTPLNLDPNTLVDKRSTPLFWNFMRQPLAIWVTPLVSSQKIKLFCSPIPTANCCRTKHCFWKVGDSSTLIKLYTVICSLKAGHYRNMYGAYLTFISAGVVFSHLINTYLILVIKPKRRSTSFNSLFLNIKIYRLNK